MVVQLKFKIHAISAYSMGKKAKKSFHTGIVKKQSKLKHQKIKFGERSAIL